MAVALLVPGLGASGASAQAPGLSDREREIIHDILGEVLGVEESAATQGDAAGKDKGGKGGKGGLPPGLAKRDQLPPGLARRDSLPPGLAKRLDDRLPGRDVKIVDDELVILDEVTGAVVDVIRDVLAGAAD